MAKFDPIKKLQRKARQARAQADYWEGRNAQRYTDWVDAAEYYESYVEMFSSMPKSQLEKIDPSVFDAQMESFRGQGSEDWELDQTIAEDCPSESTELGADLARLFAWVIEGKTMKQVALRFHVAAWSSAPGVSPFKTLAEIDKAFGYKSKRANASKYHSKFCRALGYTSKRTQKPEEIQKCSQRQKSVWATTRAS